MLSFVLVAVGIQAGFFTAETNWPEVRHHEYGCKLERLQEKLAENPGRPLVLLLGSSRTLHGLRPDVLEASSFAGSERPLIYNFGMEAAGPISQLIYLERLLDGGIRPQAVCVEVMPILLHQHAVFGEECWLQVNDITLKDIERAAPMLADPDKMRNEWWSSISRHSYFWRHLPRDRVRRKWRKLDDSGWLAGPTEIPAERRQEYVEEARKYYRLGAEDFQVTPVAERALRKLLEVCRENEIAFSLYLMPEGSGFRELYPSEGRDAVDTFVASLSREFDCPVVDATYWAEDDQFVDSQHLLVNGAELVSQRFAEQALGPFLAEALRREQSNVGLATAPAAEQLR